MQHIIKWRNVCSGEEGFVKGTSTKERCFFNTTERSEAKAYSSEAIANKTVRQLEGFGQGTAINNAFTVEKA